MSTIERGGYNIGFSSDRDTQGLTVSREEGMVVCLIDERKSGLSVLTASYWLGLQDGGTLLIKAQEGTGTDFSTEKHIGHSSSYQLVNPDEVEELLEGIASADRPFVTGMLAVARGERQFYFDTIRKNMSQVVEQFKLKT